MGWFFSGLRIPCLFKIPVRNVWRISLNPCGLLSVESLALDGILELARRTWLGPRVKYEYHSDIAR